jgi:hypothetical protein
VHAQSWQQQPAGLSTFVGVETSKISSAKKPKISLLIGDLLI